MNEYVLGFKREVMPNLPVGSFSMDIQLIYEILNAVEFADRSIVESNQFFVQIIPYSILRFEDKVFSYKRTSLGDERRLHRLYSIGVGGHINREDCYPSEDVGIKVIERARDREILEEFHVELRPKWQLMGYIYDNSNEVGRVHFGLVFENWLLSNIIRVREKAFHTKPALLTIGEILSKRRKYENWSQIIIDNYLNIQND